MTMRRPEIALFQWLLLLALTTFLVRSVESHNRSLRAEKSFQSSQLVPIPLLSHHFVNERRRRLETGTAEPSDAQVDPLYQGYGTHYVDLWVGCPPQRQTVIVDTGSAATAFPCSGCVDCGASSYHTDSLFKEAESTCFRQVSCTEGCQIGVCHDDQGTEPESCRASRKYLEGSSWVAVESIDKVYTGGNHEAVDWAEEADAFDFRFGCQTAVTGIFESQLADGIMGMKIDDASYWKQLYNAGGMSSAEFSLCFSKAPTASRQGSGAGAMIMGGTDSRLHSTPMVYAEQNPTSEGDFSITVEKIYLRTGGGESVVVNHEDAVYKPVLISSDQLNFGNVIVDSGTSATFLTKKLAIPFKKAWMSATGQDYDTNHFEVDAGQLDSLPTIIFQMQSQAGDNDQSLPGITGADFDKWHPNSVLVAMPPSHYMTYISKRGTYVSHINFTVNKKKSQTLGANFLMGHDIHFDVDKDRIGFAESDCDYFAFGLKNFKNTTQAVEASSEPIIAPANAAPSIQTPTIPAQSPETDTMEPEPRPAVANHGGVDETGSAPPNDDDTYTETPAVAVTACSSLTCQGGLVVAFLGWMGLVVVLLMRNPGGSTKSKHYQATLQSLEEDGDNDGRQGAGACELSEFKPYSDKGESSESN